MIFRQFLRLRHSITMDFSEDILAEIEKVRGRIKVVTCENECKSITEELLKSKAISVDLEAIQKSPGLVQVGDASSSNIFLFRTGINAKLFTNGGLKNLLESPNVTKVFHAAVMDCMSLQKAGIYVDPLFDTSVAHAVIQFQNHGLPYTSAIGLNNLCEFYAVPTNPLKDSHKGYFWAHMEKKFYKKDTLPDDLILYSAYDVVPILDLYDILRNLIRPDFESLFHEMIHDMLIRPIDENLANTRRKERRAELKRQLFLTNLNPMVNKGHIYEKLLSYQGQKRVQMATNSAVVTLDNRQDLLEFYHDMLNKGFSVKLFKDEKSENEVVEENFDLFGQIIEKLIQFEVAVALLFVNTPQSNIVELVFNDSSAVKFDLKDDRNTKLIGRLMQSNVVKIIPRLNLRPVMDAFVTLNGLGYNFSNIFDIDSAAKVCDNHYHKKAILSSSSQKLNSICQKYDIALSTKKREIFDIYFHLNKIIPEVRSNAFPELMTLHITSALGEDKAATKKAKNAFKLQYDVHNEEFEVATTKAEKVDKIWLHNQNRIHEEKLEKSGIYELIDKINKK